jgi:hypothetical protein
MTVSNYLSPQEAAEALLAGVSLQQWLGVRVSSDGFRFIRWVEVDADPRGGWNIYDHDSLDSGDPMHRDMTSFHNDLDPDCPEGVCHRCNSIDAVLTKCSELGCSPSAFVRFCGIQLLYDAYVSANGYPARKADEYFTSGYSG